MNNAKQEVKGLPEMKLFKGEGLLVLTGLIGLGLAAGIAIYIAMYGSVILPEGNAESAFSFNAALGLFTLSMAAIFPLAGLQQRNRAMVRRFFIAAALLAYALETIQHFRGINPRFSQSSSIFDIISGILFGVDSLLLILVILLVAIPFFRKRQPDQRPLLVLGIRYSFLSIFVGFAAGIWMIMLQGRYTGGAGNLIVLHGLAFHSLQTLPLLGWLLDRLESNEPKARRLLHTGGIAWMLSIVLVGAQTYFGRSAFEAAPLPLLALIALLICLIVIAAAVWAVFQNKGAKKHVRTIV
ncbi:MAG: hypothetical protein K0S39_3756 [Paenibacillus sp.]|jgi:hypothetical protein|nr:hypothetical protein [Paenibacillus sp.]